MENELGNKNFPRNQPTEISSMSQESVQTPNQPLSFKKQLKEQKQIFFGLLIFLVALVGLAGFLTYRNYQSKKQAPSAKNSPMPTLIPTTHLSPTQVSIGEIDSQLTNSHNSFGFKIFQSLTGQDADKNAFISPSSIALALSMIYNGAKAETKEAMAKTLEIQNMTLEELNQASQSLLSLLKDPDEKVTISIANSIWAKQGIQFNPDFSADNQKYYQAKVTSLNFESPEAVKTINDWVNDNTKGKIPTIIASPIPPEMVMYLINAIYFKGTWTCEFDPESTKDREFTSVDSSIKIISMMEQKETFPYFETDDFQAVSLPYGENKRLRMDIFLPKNDLAQFFQGLNLDQWKTWITQFHETEGTIILPKFKMEYEKTLNDSLRALGMDICFGGTANFERLGRNLYISEVKHKTFIEVNEEGTEAAAVTSVGVGITSINSEKKTFYMEVNRPFFFAIRDSQTGAILFMGVIQKL